MSRDPALNRAYAPSVRTSLAVLVVGCILPIALVAAFLILDFYERGQAQLNITAISRARAIVAAVDQDFANTQAALQALATSPLLDKGDLGAFHAQAVEAVQNLKAEQLVIVDMAGQMLLTTRQPFGKPLPKMSNPSLEKLRRTLQTGRSAVSDLFPGPLAGRLIYTIAVPVQANGLTRYSLNATVVPDRLSSMLAAQKLPDSWRGAIIDSTGSVVARTHDIEKFLGAKVNPDLLQRLSATNEDAFETRTLEGIPVITAFSRSPVTKWTVSLGMPLAELTTGLRQTLALLIVATIAALGMGLALAWFIGGRIAASISALARPLKALGAGETLTIPHLHFKEANDMANALLDAESTLNRSKYDAHHDVLTGLANRELFHIVVNQQIALCERNKTGLAVLYIDLDGFKAVNDTLGHAAGDELLRAVSVRVKDTIRASDIAARLGGDEFAIALIDSDLEDASTFAGRLVEIISAVYPLAAGEAMISASIGVAAYPVSATDVDTLLIKADRAMYQAKALGKRRVCAAIP